MRRYSKVMAMLVATMFVGRVAVPDNISIQSPESGEVDAGVYVPSGVFQTVGTSPVVVLDWRNWGQFGMQSGNYDTTCYNEQAYWDWFSDGDVYLQADMLPAIAQWRVTVGLSANGGGGATASNEGPVKDTAVQFP